MFERLFSHLFTCAKHAGVGVTFVSVHTPYPVKSCVLRRRPVALDSIHVFNDRIKIRENRGL